MKGGESRQFHGWSRKNSGHLLVTVVGSSLQQHSWSSCSFHECVALAISTRNQSTYACMSTWIPPVRRFRNKRLPFDLFRHWNCQQRSASTHPHLLVNTHTQWRRILTVPLQPLNLSRAFHSEVFSLTLNRKFESIPMVLSECQLSVNFWFKCSLSPSQWLQCPTDKHINTQQTLSHPRHPKPLLWIIQRACFVHRSFFPPLTHTDTSFT